MKISLKLISLLLAVAFVLPMALVSCNNDKDKENEKENEVLTILADGKSDYTIVRPDKMDSLALKAVTTFRAAFEDKFGTAPDIKSDYVRRGEEIPTGTKEILIGETNRPESEEAMKSVEEDGFIIKVYGERIAIVADGDAMLFEAVNYFIQTYITPSTDKVEIPADYIYIGNGDTYSPATDNGDGTVTLSLKRFVIVYDSQNEQTFVPSVAQAFAERVTEVSSVVGCTEDASVNKYEILFGACDREEFKTADKDFLFRDFYVEYSGKKLSVSAFSIYGYESAINFLLDGFGEDGLTIPTEGLYKEYDYGTGAYAELYKNYENPTLEGAWMVNVCHRGDITTRNNPENSIPSYQSCIDNLVDVIETDLHKTKDGVWVISHDATIDRTTTGKGTIAQMTYEQTQQYNLLTKNGGSGSSPTAYTIPKLTEVIDLCKGKLLFNLDKLDPTIFQEVYDVFEQEDAVEMAMFKYSGWSAQELTKWFCELLADGRKLPLYSPLLYSNTQQGCVSFKGLTSMTETGRDLSEKTLAYIRDECNIRTMCLTALNPDLENFTSYTQFKDLGYTAIMTDAPGLLKEFVHGK